MPQTSIIIRTFNEEKYLPKVLDAIKKQSYQDYEIILVDSGSTDSTLAIAKPICNKIISIESRDFTFGYSLNVGCRNAQGQNLVLLSAHAIPTNEQWLEKLIAPLQIEHVGMVYGRQIGGKETKFSEQRDFERYYGATCDAPRPYPYYTNNANSALKAYLWKEIPFDEYLPGLEDIAWARTMSHKGYEVIYVPESTIYHMHEEAWPRVYNRYRREAIAARFIGIPHPPLAHPSLRYFFQNLAQDLQYAISHSSRPVLQEIFKFRYHQWRGARHGWLHSSTVDLKKDRDELFFHSANKGVVIEKASHAIFKEIPIPEVKPSDVLIKVSYVGVCATDLEVYDGSLGYYKDGRAKYPVIPGHEFSGIVSRVGANVSDLIIGDRVVGECVLSCRMCDRCRSGSYVACDKRKEVGVMNYNGAYAKFVVLRAAHVHKIQEVLDLKTACLAEPLAVVLRGLRRLGERLKPQSQCAVVGAGPIGNLCAQVLAMRGHHVTVFNRREQRLKFIKSPMATCRTLENLKEFDVIIEASGNVKALKQVLCESRSDATLLLLGFPYGEMPYNFEDVVGREKVIIGSVGGACEDFQKALEILPMLDTAPFKETIFSLESFSNAWDAHRSSDFLKIILEVEKPSAN